MSPNAFSTNVFNNFQNSISGLHKRIGEVELFRSLINAFVKSSSGLVHVEEYHGNKKQVSFNGSVVTSRPVGRCELADVLLVSFSSTHIRVTFVQAKYDRVITSNTLLVGSMKCDPEQWDLLAKRQPILNGWNGFNPPRDLLSGAYSSSIGSFGFFYKTQHGFDLFYSVANYLKLNQNSYSSKNGSLKSTLSTCCTRQAVGPLSISETLNCCNLGCFSRNIAMGLIGSPVFANNSIISNSTASWLLSALREYVQTNSGQELVLAKKLISMLLENRVETSNSSFNSLPKMLVINSSDESILKSSDYRPFLF